VPTDDDFELTFSDQNRLTKSEASARKEALKRELAARGQDPRLADHADLSQSKIRLSELKAKMEKGREQPEEKDDQSFARTKTREQQIRSEKMDAKTKVTTEETMRQSNEQQEKIDQSMQDEVQSDQTA